MGGWGGAAEETRKSAMEKRQISLVLPTQMFKKKNGIKNCFSSRLLNFCQAAAHGMDLSDVKGGRGRW